MNDIYEIIKAQPDMDVDEQRNVFHCKEGVGNDRLYIKRTDNGYIYHCFHCGKSGGVRAATIEGAAPRVKPRHTGVHGHGAGGKGYGDRRTTPSDCVKDWGGWHPRARGWVGKYITRAEVEENGLLYSPGLRRVVLPVYDSDGLVGYQTRKILDEDDGPKYQTFTLRPQDFYYYRDGGSVQPTVCLVEDMLSAIKCSRYMPAAALFGVSLKDTLLSLLVSKHTKFLIFLDDDNPQVKLSAMRMKKRLDIFGECVIIRGVGMDPKECDDVTLKGILT